MQTYLLYQHGKGVNISKDFAISYGTRRHSDYHERIHASQIGRCEGRIGADESKGAVKKEMTLADMEYAKKEIKRVSSI